MRESCRLGNSLSLTAVGPGAEGQHMAARYIDAFIANLDWEVIDARSRAALE
jgi:hypothetical protein